MGIITLTTDWGLKDFYVGAVKGAILSILPEVRLVDITHNIKPFDIDQASYTIKNAYKHFPDGTVHIIGILTEASLTSPHMAIKYRNHFFIGADNGIFSLVFDEIPSDIIELEIFHDSDSFTFPTIDVFVKAAIHLVQGNNISELGVPRQTINELNQFKPASTENSIIGKVLYIDGYENVVFNITKQLFKEVGRGRAFTINFKTIDYEISTICKSYMDVPVSEIVAIFGSNDLLEIAINKGNAASLLGIDYDKSIMITFLETK